MYKCLHQEHRSHFCQAQGSPATEHSISTLFGKDTDTQFSEVFQHGFVKVHHFPGITEGLQLLFKELQQKPTSPPYIDNEILVEEVKRGFRIWKQRTSTSPSGRHLGLYKVWLQKASEEKTILTVDEFFGLITRMKNLAVKAKYTPNWW
eukprot:14961964-Ditylum_brightwellii.AAC.1